MNIDHLKNEIEDLYVDQGATLATVITYLEQEHSIIVTPRVLNSRLKKWGIRKNVTRSQVFSLARAAAQNDLENHPGLPERPVRAANLERYLRRNKIAMPTSVPTSFQSPHIWNMHERIFHSSLAYITSSFQSLHWFSAGRELIIMSSTNQTFEKTALHQFLGHLDMAMNASSIRQKSSASEHWKQAFENVDTLLVGQYHDVLPNILQKINDLKVKGYLGIARELQNYLAESLLAHKTRGPTVAIFQALRLIHLDDMADIEEGVMQGYVDVFERFLGLDHYNSFVMRMNLIRRQLLRRPNARLEDYMPSLIVFDNTYGELDTRCLDIIRLRTEILHHRNDHARVDTEAQLLIQRAHRKVDDPWQRPYFLIKGYFYLGLAQYRQGELYNSRYSMLQCIEHIIGFSAVDEHGIFDAEREVLNGYLQEIESRVEEHNSWTRNAETH